MSDVNETFSDISRPTDLHSANIIPFQPDEGIFKVPDLPPWRLKAKETKERRRILRISDPRRKRVRRRKVRHDEDYSFLEIYKMNIEYMYAEKHESRLSMSEKISVQEDMPIAQLVEKNQEEEANLGDPMSDNDSDENETVAESNSSFEVSGEEDVDSDGECDEELEATVLKIMEKTREFRKLNKIWKADDILDLEMYHLPQLYMKCPGKENKLPDNLQVVKIDPFMISAEINSVGRSVIDVGLDILIELGELVLNPIAAFNEHFYLVKKRITAHSDRGDIFNRCHSRDPRIEPPVWYEFCQAAEKMSAEAKAKHPRANQYPSKFSYELIEFCEDPYWENHEGKIPDGLQIPQRPFDIEDVRNNRIPDSEAPREESPEEIPMFITGSQDDNEHSP